jgi:hypothetical protein
MPLTEGTSPRETRFSGIFARLSELPNYVWDSDIKPFHSVSFLHPVRRARLIPYSPTTTGTFLATKRPPPYQNDRPLEGEAPLPRRPPHTRQTRTAHQTLSDTNHLAAMPVPPQRRHRPPPRPSIGRDGPSYVEYRATHCGSSENTSCPRSLSASQIQHAGTLSDPSNSSDCLPSLERSPWLPVSSRHLGRTI